MSDLKHLVKTMSEHRDPKKRPLPIVVPPLPVCTTKLEPILNHDSSTQKPTTQRKLALDRDLARANHNSAAFSDKSPEIENVQDGLGSMAAKRSSPTRSSNSKYSEPSTVSTKYNTEYRQETTRAQIEDQHERKWFKMAGQIPPTPMLKDMNEHDIYVRTQDLRARCRVASLESQIEPDEPPVSPKKWLLGNLKSAFNRSQNNAIPAVHSMPPMPPKAAQILGKAPCNPRKSRILKPAVPYVTPTKTVRSDISNSLPTKTAKSQHNIRRNLKSATHHGHAAVGHNMLSFDTDSVTLGIGSDTESVLPPTPPAKDTPPNQKPVVRPPSPLRRTQPSQHLHEMYGAHVIQDVNLLPPKFALSALPSQSAMLKNGQQSPTKLDFTSTESCIEAAQDNIHEVVYPYAAGFDMRLDSPACDIQASEPLKIERSVLNKEVEHNQDDGHAANVTFHHYHTFSQNPFLSRPDSLVRSQNIDESRFTLQDHNKMSLQCTNGEVDKSAVSAIFQCNEDNTGLLTSVDNAGLLTSVKGTTSEPAHNVTAPLETDQTLAISGIMTQEVNDDDSDLKSRQLCNSAREMLEHSTSGLTEMLNGLTPFKHDYGSGNGFLPNCPSAVPSPLHKNKNMMQPRQFFAGPGNIGEWGPQNPPKTIEDHFYMTNEHLDVVGKTTWDLLDHVKQQHIASLNTKHEQHVAMVDKHMEGMKSELSMLNEKADRAAEKHNHVHVDVEKMCSFVHRDLAKALARQSEMTSETEKHVKELQKTVQGLQKMLEEKLGDPKAQVQGSTSNSVNHGALLPMQRSQPLLGNYFGGAPGFVRENDAAVPQLHEDRSVPNQNDMHHDARGGYNHGVNSLFGARYNYPGRNGRDERSSCHGTQPFYGDHNGQFAGSYTAGYPAYNFSVDTPEQHVN